uniref:Uncharacterized protein n=1 Tax=Amphiprion percula TaxID=161767 RepID=A0A3P8RLE2_AMPPE
ANRTPSLVGPEQKKRNGGNLRGGGADPEPVGAAGVSAKTSRLNSTGGEPDSPSWSRAQASLGVFQTRSIFHLPRRSSSGYFSADGADSVPSSPLSPKRLTADKATQTPSPSGQVIKHALERMTDEAHGGGPGTQQHGELRLTYTREISCTFNLCNSFCTLFSVTVFCHLQSLFASTLQNVLIRFINPNYFSTFWKRC